MMIPEAMKEIIDVEEETDERLVELANKEKAIMIALIAPYIPRRVSPVEERRARIGLSEEFGVETVITEIQNRANGKIPKVYLLINSPGGFVTSSYKVAKALRDAFENITVFVPHIAASGGTLIALTGNKTVMGMVSALTPLDVMVSYKDNIVSPMAMFRSFAKLNKYFEKKRVNEVPYPWKAMTDKLDPVLMEAWAGTLETVRGYVEEILEKSGYENAKEIAIKMVMGFKDHSEVITYEKAKEIGLNVEPSSDHPEVWSLMRYWLSIYMLQSADKHVIRFVIPNLEE